MGGMTQSRLRRRNPLDRAFLGKRMTKGTGAGPYFFPLALLSDGTTWGRREQRVRLWWWRTQAKSNWCILKQYDQTKEFRFIFCRFRVEGQIHLQDRPELVVSLPDSRQTNLIWNWIWSTVLEPQIHIEGEQINHLTNVKADCTITYLLCSNIIGCEDISPSFNPFSEV